MCDKLTAIAQRLKILPGKVREAIEMAILNGVTTTTAIYNFAIDFLTNQITCDNILSPVVSKQAIFILTSTDLLGQPVYFHKMLSD